MKMVPGVPVEEETENTGGQRCVGIVVTKYSIQRVLTGTFHGLWLSLNLQHFRNVMTCTFSFFLKVWHNVIFLYLETYFVLLVGPAGRYSTHSNFFLGNSTTWPTEQSAGTYENFPSAEKMVIQYCTINSTLRLWLLLRLRLGLNLDTITQLLILPAGLVSTGLPIGVCPRG